MQKNRGFFEARGTISFDERRKLIEETTKDTQRGACGQTGHWAGDVVCPKTKSKGAGKGRKGPQARGKALARSITSSSAGESAGSPAQRPKRSHSSYFVVDDADFFSDAESTCFAKVDMPDSGPTSQVTVACPSCSQQMVRRQNRTNKGWFWGCGAFPSCKGARTYEEGSKLAAEVGGSP